MNMHKKRIARRGAAFVCAFGVALSAMPVHAAEVKSLEDKTSNLQSQLEGINQDLVTLSNKIAETEAEIEESNNEVYRLEASLQISRNNEEKQYETMKTRIKYMYENGSETMITMLFTADSMGDFLNKAEFIQNITDYDKEMLENMMEIRQGIETQEEDLKSQQQELTDLQSQLNTEQQNLQAKAAATSTDLATVNAQLQAAREEQAKQEEEAQKKAQEEAAKQASASTGNNTSGSSSSNGKYNIPSGGLTPSKGRIWFNGHTETYYSQKVLPGAGLNIPGRHIASDGTIRDKDGYIVLASDDYPKGTVVETSLGAGKVYDSGSGKGNIDLYTDW
jgi:peptidoglycan hydrolase CwlO-like protein